MKSKEKALALAEATNQKKGFDVRILDLRGTASFTDFFVIATGASDRHVRTLAEATLEAAQRYGERPLGIEGEKTARKEIEAEVLKVDHFGNIRTSINRLTWVGDDALTLQPIFGQDAGAAESLTLSAAATSVTVGPLTIDGISVTFSDVEIGQPIAFVGSENALEIAINQGDAASAYGVSEGDSVTLHLRA